MDFQEIEKILDFFWFEHQIFSSKPISIQPSVNVTEECQEIITDFSISSSSPSFLIRSFSDQNFSSSKSVSSNSDKSNISPSSVLELPKLQTIQSGKEFGEVGYNNNVWADNKGEIMSKNVQKELGTKRKKKRGSKSLSELEIEELKGFMDLGFEFKNEDKDSNLVLIVPGLQRLGGMEEGNRGEDENRVSRPYLSEAWDALEKKNQLLMNWRIPAFGNEVELKNHLKFWAHTIASNVR